VAPPACPRCPNPKGVREQRPPLVGGLTPTTNSPAAIRHRLADFFRGLSATPAAIRHGILNSRTESPCGRGTAAHQPGPPEGDVHRTDMDAGLSRRVAPKARRMPGFLRLRGGGSGWCATRGQTDMRGFGCRRTGVRHERPRSRNGRGPGGCSSFNRGCSRAWGPDRSRRLLNRRGAGPFSGRWRSPRTRRAAERPRRPCAACRVRRRGGASCSAGLLGFPGDRALERVAADQQRVDRAQVVQQRDLCAVLGEVDPTQPVTVASAPGTAGTVMAQRQLAEAMPGAHRVAPDILARAPGRAAPPLPPRARACAMQPTDHQQPHEPSASAIGLDTIARRPLDLARRGDDALDPGRLERPRQPKAGRPGLRGLTASGPAAQRRTQPTAPSPRAAETSAAPPTRRHRHRDHLRGVHVKTSPAASLGHGRFLLCGCGRRARRRVPGGRPRGQPSPGWPQAATAAIPAVVTVALTSTVAQLAAGRRVAPARRLHRAGDAAADVHGAVILSLLRRRGDRGVRAGGAGPLARSARAARDLRRGPKRSRCIRAPPRRAGGRVAPAQATAREAARRAPITPRAGRAPCAGTRRATSVAFPGRAARP
jgi:hypothetical protein